MYELQVLWKDDKTHMRKFKKAPLQITHPDNCLNPTSLFYCISKWWKIEALLAPLLFLFLITEMKIFWFFSLAGLQNKSSENGDYIHHTLTYIYIDDHEPGIALHKSSRASTSGPCWHSNIAYKTFSSMAHKTFSKMPSLLFEEAASFLYCTWKLFISLFKVKMPFPLSKMSWHVICYSAS